MSTSGDAGKLGVRHAPQTVSFQGTRSHFSYNSRSESESFFGFILVLSSFNEGVSPVYYEF